MSYLEAYKKMFLIRRAEEQIADLYLREKIMSFVHFYVGQEAVAVGVCQAIGKEDRVMGNHRSHGHYLAKGGDLGRMIAELLGKSNGLAKGKGGSMHMIDKSVNFIGSTPILGSVVPIANGSAFEQKYSGKNSLTVVFCGDGAFEEGVVYETINLASLFKLPLLLVVENNLFSVNSKISERRSSGYETSKIVSGLGATYLKADGNDFLDVNKKAVEAVSHIRGGNGPIVLECVTYRHMAHSAPIWDENYRAEDTKQNREEKDALKRLRTHLLENEISEEGMVDIEKDISLRVEESIQHALGAKFPDTSDLYSNVYD